MVGQASSLTGEGSWSFQEASIENEDIVEEHGGEGELEEQREALRQNRNMGAVDKELFGYSLLFLLRISLSLVLILILGAVTYRRYRTDTDVFHSISEGGYERLRKYGVFLPIPFLLEIIPYFIAVIRWNGFFIRYDSLVRRTSALANLPYDYFTVAWWTAVLVPAICAVASLSYLLETRRRESRVLKISAASVSVYSALIVVWSAPLTLLGNFGRRWEAVLVFFGLLSVASIVYVLLRSLVLNMTGKVR